MKGLIIIGYQGIGKSSHAGTNNCVDLESSLFRVEGNRIDKWQVPYCNAALHIASQGYTVFTSSHKVVRDCFKSLTHDVFPKNNVGKIVIFCPRLSMREDWIEKLRDRYDKTKLLKDFSALKNAEAMYDANIHELVNDIFPVYQPNAMDYNLSDYIHKMRMDWCA